METIYYDEIITDTDDAWLLKLDEKSQDWFPKSIYELDEEAKEILVPDWLAIKKGLV